MVVLEVSSADKRGKDFTQVQGPRVEVTPLRPACLLLLCEYEDYKGSRRDVNLARVWCDSGVSWSGSMALPALK